MTCLSLAIMFVLTESSSLGIWHHNRESENRFWIIVTAIFTSALLFASDSPLRIGRQHPIIGMVLILFSALYVNHYDRQLSRVSLTRTPHLRRVSSLLLVNQESARSKLKLVNDSLEALDFKFVLMKGIRRADITANEMAIVKTFEEANEDELNYLVTNVNLSLLFYKLKDRDVMTWNRGSQLSRTRIIACLCESRLPLLHTAARVNLIDALMNLRLKAHIDAERLAANIILNTFGRGLTRLKTACDAKGTITNLHKLVFRDFSSHLIREQVLAHIKREADILLSDPRHSSTTRRKILSDVDDTLFSSGGRFPAGIDVSYPKGALYPGVLTFYKELDLGVSDTGEWSSGRLGNLVFLSARPHVYKDKAESRSYLQFEQLRVQKGIGLHCVPTLLAGSLDSGWRMLFRGDFAALAATKCANFIQFAQLYPEFTFVFIGDNGQGDVMAAANMKELLGDRLEGVFIHLVQPIQQTPGYLIQSDEQRKLWSSFHFFRTYISAALFAAQRELIHDTALTRVASHAITRLIEMKDLINAAEWDARRQETNKDIEQTNTYLESVKLNNMPFIPSDCKYPISGRVLTMFGSGCIRSFEPIQSMYSIELLDWRLSNDRPVFLRQHQNEVELIKVGTVGSRVFVTPLGLTGIIENIRASDRIYQIALIDWPLRGRSVLPPSPIIDSTSILRSNFARCYVNASDCIEIIAAVGELVHCAPFGYGIVRRYRASDGIYEIALRLSGESRVSYRDRGRKLKSILGTNVASGLKMCNSMLYTPDLLRRVDEEESKQRLCAVM